MRKQSIGLAAVLASVTAAAILLDNEEHQPAPHKPTLETTLSRENNPDATPQMPIHTIPFLREYSKEASYRRPSPLNTIVDYLESHLIDFLATRENLDSSNQGYRQGFIETQAWTVFYQKTNQRFVFDLASGDEHCLRVSFTHDDYSHVAVEFMQLYPLINLNPKQEVIGEILHSTVIDRESPAYPRLVAFRETFDKYVQ